MTVLELACATPDAWIAAAVRQRDVLLIDHANCEKKAAGTALSLLYRYVEDPELLACMSRLAREELRHFEEVVALMRRLSIDYAHVSPSRYASALQAHVRQSEPGRLIDLLLVGAVVEARSCERFERLGAVLDGAHGALYRRLWASEARHAGDYLALARRYDDGSVDARLARLVATDAELVSSPDPDFRFHSGMPLA